MNLPAYINYYDERKKFFFEKSEIQAMDLLSNYKCIIFLKNLNVRIQILKHSRSAKSPDFAATTVEQN